MAYGNFNRGNFQNANFSPRNNGGRGFTPYTGGNNNSYPVNRPRPKHSGCKAGKDKNGNPYVRGWNYSKQFGLRSFYAAPYKGTGKHKSDNGREWHNWFVTISQIGAQDIKTSGLYDPSSGKVTIKELGFVMNPRANNGGYCGRYIKSKNSGQRY